MYVTDSKAPMIETSVTTIRRISTDIGSYVGDFTISTIDSRQFYLHWKNNPIYDSSKKRFGGNYYRPPLAPALDSQNNYYMQNYLKKLEYRGILPVSLGCLKINKWSLHPFFEMKHQ